MYKTGIIPGLSFWETETYLKNIDLIVIGSGIVGLNAAISYKKHYKNARVLVLERGILPSGASTKNAGFACFGSVSELLSDIQHTNEDTVWKTVEMRIKGLEMLRRLLGDKAIDYKEYGGYELFDTQHRLEECCDAIPYINKQVRSLTREASTYHSVNRKFFKKSAIKGLIFNSKEGQIDTGKMMANLIQLAVSSGIQLLNAMAVDRIEDTTKGVNVITPFGVFNAANVIVATNGFATELLNIKEVKPARAQVLITKPIKDLKLKGTFHYDEGYYYFRNIGNRILFGGGRNLDFEIETTTELGLNQTIQQKLDQLLHSMILPDVHFEIEQRWSGIMGIGNEKKPIIRKISPHVVCAVRMGGMGIAIGSLVGKLAVEEL